MENDTELRDRLVELLRGGDAHAPFDGAVKDFPRERAGERPEGSPHSAWELLEHLRIAQHDILEFSKSAEWVSPQWPHGYWPASPKPQRASLWDDSVKAFHSDLEAFAALVLDPARDLYTPFPWGDGQNLLREALVLADHNSYHIGQLVLVRQQLGVWHS